MRRRRHRLQVSTFPFMAVLLCAMGSLILLLLIMDRQGKKAALAAALAKKAHRKKTSTRQAPEDIVEREVERLHTQVCRLEAIRWALQQEQRDVQEEIYRERKRTADIRDRVESLQRRYAKSGEKLERQRRQTDRLRAVATALDQDLADLAARLQQARMRLAARKKDETIKKTVFSLVPYRGPRGESRNPIYAECRAGGVVLLPPRVELIGSAFSAEAIRKELRQRIATYSDPEGRRPYLLLLVRPEGIRSFYAIREAISGLPIDLGYELVDGEWTIEVNLGEGKTTMLAGKPSPYHPGGPMSPAKGGGSRFEAGRGPTAIGGSPTQPGSSGTTNKNVARPAARPPSPTRAVDVASTPTDGKSAGPRKQPQGKRSTSVGNQSDDVQPPPISHDWYIAVECSAGGVRIPVLRRQYALRELQAPLGSGRDHPLTQALAGLIEHRRTIARAQGRAYRPIIKFEVAPDGLRSYHLTYPLLETLNVPMIRQNLSPAPLP